jgi:hypothetical protein
MHKSATKCNETLGKWCKNKHGTSKIIDTLETYQEANTVFVGCILSILDDRLCDMFMHIKDRKELWDALDAKFGTADASSNCTSWRAFMILR